MLCSSHDPIYAGHGWHATDTHPEDAPPWKAALCHVGEAIWQINRAIEDLKGIRDKPTDEHGNEYAGYVGDGPPDASNPLNGVPERECWVHSQLRTAQGLLYYMEESIAQRAFGR